MDSYRKRINLAGNQNQRPQHRFPKDDDVPVYRYDAYLQRSIDQQNLPQNSINISTMNDSINFRNNMQDIFATDENRRKAIRYVLQARSRSPKAVDNSIFNQRSTSRKPRKFERSPQIVQNYKIVRDEEPFYNPSSRNNRRYNNEYNKRKLNYEETDSQPEIEDSGVNEDNGGYVRKYPKRNKDIAIPKKDTDSINNLNDNDIEEIMRINEEYRNIINQQKYDIKNLKNDLMNKNKENNLLRNELEDTRIEHERELEELKRGKAENENI